RQANASGAAAKFQAAIALVPDARFYFNLCLAREAEGKFPAAGKACRQVKSATGSSERLREKAAQRLDIIAKKSKG
ncbi:MAG: hypothetical protein KJO07_21435, partial [Deltaproteobacteria bacterium]|nr:hypothetical protein [Deltaproteobacteria bacterium]